MSLDNLFHSVFNKELVADLVECERKAYAANLSVHDPSVGHDAASFGFLNYKSRVHYLKQLADDERGITLARVHPFFALRVGEFQLSTYNAGDSSETELASCFPRNKRRAKEVAGLNAKQLTLDLGLPTEDEDANCRHLILCDLGDAINGLSAVFIGVPVGTENGKISKWSRVYSLWQREEYDFTPVDTPTFPIAPVTPVEVIQRVKLTLKQKPQALPDLA